MKLALTLLALLFVGVISAHFLIEDSGSVLVTFHGWQLETSVPVLVLLLVLVYIGVRLLLRLLEVPRNIRRAAESMRAKRARENLAQGLLALDAGDWARGERLLGRSAHDADAPLLHYLAAARAAEQQGASDRRDRWLALAGEVKEGGEVAVALAQIEALVGAGEYDAAAKGLAKLDEIAPAHPQALALRARVCEQRGDWDAVRTLLPRLRKAHALPPAALESLEVRAQARAIEAAAARSANDVRAAWRALPRSLTSKAELWREYAKALETAGDRAGAEEAIRQGLAAQWDAGLVQRYGELRAGDDAKQLERAEQWLKEHPDDPALLLAVARLCIRNELWGKARSYLEAAIAIRPTVEAYRTLGELLERLGERELAAEAFRTGLALATGHA